MKNVKKWMWGLTALLMMSLMACNDRDDVASEVIVLSSFENGTDGWTGDYAEYSASMDRKMAFDLTRTTSPSLLNQN